MNIKKVALLTSTFFPSIGGVEVGIHNIALRLIDKGIEPIIIAPYSSKKYKEKDKLPYTIISMPPKFFHMFKYMPKNLAKQLYNLFYAYLQNKYNFDIWHITMGYPAGISFVDYGNKNKIPYIVRCAGSDIQVSDIGKYGERRNKKIDNLIKAKLPLINTLISISNSVYKEYKKLNIEDKKIVNITNGVDVDLFKKVLLNKEDIYKKYNIPFKNKIFLSVGRNHPKKNFKLLFDIAQILKKKNFNDFTFIIVGDNTKELSQYLTKEIESNFLLLNSFGIDFKDGIPIIPHIELVKLYKISNLFVFPSFIETFGIVLVEAMAAGLPIITTNVEGCKDLIEDGKNGYLLNPKDANSFAEKIIELNNNKQLYDLFSKNNLLKAEQYDWDIVVDKYIKLYERLV